MKVQTIYTLNELKKITPSLTREHFLMECPKVKEALKIKFFIIPSITYDYRDGVNGIWVCWLGYGIYLDFTE